MGLSPNGYTANTLEHVFSRSNSALSIIFSGLLKSVRFQRLFIRDLDRYLDGVLAPDNALRHIRRLGDTVRPDMRWEVEISRGTVEHWEGNIGDMEEFVENRGPVIRTAILNSTRFSFPRILKVVPAKITLDEEVEVTLRGRRLTADTSILFAGIPSPKVVFRSLASVKATVPFDVRLEGWPEITASDPLTGSSTSRNMLHVVLPPPGSFLRGEANGDGRVNLADALTTLEFLFQAGATPVCEDALDMDDSGNVNLVDAVFLLNYLFGRGEPPAPPFEACGADTTPDELGCEGPTACRR